MKHKFIVEVVQTNEVEVVIDDESMNEQFMAEFRQSFYRFHTLKDHAEHLAQMFARGLYGGSDFVEGYGRINGYKGDEGDPTTDVTVRIINEDVETNATVISSK